MEFEKALEGLEESLGQRFDSRIGVLEEKLDTRTGELEEKIDARYTELEEKIDSRTGELERKLDSRTGDLQESLDDLGREMNAGFASVERGQDLILKVVRGHTTSFAAVDRSLRELDRRVTRLEGLRSEP